MDLLCVVVASDERLIVHRRYCILVHSAVGSTLKEGLWNNVIAETRCLTVLNTTNIYIIYFSLRRRVHTLKATDDEIDTVALLIQS